MFDAKIHSLLLHTITTTHTLVAVLPIQRLTLFRTIPHPTAAAAQEFRPVSAAHRTRRQRVLIEFLGRDACGADEFSLGIILKNAPEILRAAAGVGLLERLHVARIMLLQRCHVNECINASGVGFAFRHIQE